MIIRTWTSRRARRVGEPPRWILFPPAGAPAPRAAVLWERNVSVRILSGRLDARGDEIRADVYRAARQTRYPDWGELQTIAVPCLAVDPGIEEASYVERTAASDVARRETLWACRVTAVRETIQDLRGEASLGAWIDVAPLHMSMGQADAAAIMCLRSEHLQRGVRAIDGEWQGYIGVGGHLRPVATCDTREEALVVATAALWRSWLSRVEEIRHARGGRLDWGFPLAAPIIRDDDPQAQYHGATCHAIE